MSKKEKKRKGKGKKPHQTYGIKLEDRKGNIMTEFKELPWEL